MQNVQRKFGKIWNKGPGDNAKVSVLLNDYEDADKALAKIIDGNKAWRDSWVALVHTQLGVVVEYEALYDPIVGASDGHGTEGVPTPEVQLNRTFRLKQAYAELKEEILDEISQIEDRVVKPATDARDCIQPIRKTIKKRENKRLDYEKSQAKFAKLHQKSNRTAKEETSLAKTEVEMAALADEFSIADAHLRETLPPIITAAFSIIQPLLSAHVLIQNRLLGLYYTTLNTYCEEFGFPSPPPPMEDVIAEWRGKFTPVQKDMESITCISRGRAAHQSMSLGSDGQSRARPALAPMAARDGFRRSSSGLIPGSQQQQQRSPRNPSPSSIPPSPAASEPSRGNVRRPDYLAPTDFTTATVLGQSPGDTPISSPRRSQTDYFGGSSGGGGMAIRSSASQQALREGIAKKKPPPPPPMKRPAPPPRPPQEFVVALYEFVGQGEGDLSFREGDRIKIVKKTATDQDWWVGELGGVRGNFPANYCKPA